MSEIKTEYISLSATEKIGLISNLSTMLSAGISILETVDSILEDAKGNQKKILETLRADLVQGEQLHTSFAKFPNVFDKVTVNIIRAAEEAGTLDVTLKDLRENIRKQTEFSDKVKGALIYPVVIMFVFAGVLLMILVFVIPKISSVFLRMKMKLPLPTRILMFASNTLLTQTIPVIAIITVVVFGFIFLYRRNKKLIINLLFSIPLLRELAKEIDLTNFTRSLYLLLNAGIPITAALDLTFDIVTKNEVATAIRHCKDLVLSGKKLSEGFKDAKNIFPSIMIKITEAGEKSGSLDKSMQDISEYLDYQVSKTLHTTTTLMEPLILVVVGVLVGGMMMSILSPIYGMIGQIGAR
ncbi:type II secretion system F family protein [Candidatus Gottesmanbacteria bacterium]|nr:type II secretion system F family protein [Candidatus Gottesmanbacteria bacterium]